MFYLNLTSMTPYKGEIKTLKFKNDGKPMWANCLKTIRTDIDGKKWYINGYVNGHILACPYIEMFHTATNQMNSYNRFIPYKVELV